MQRRSGDIPMKVMRKLAVAATAAALLAGCANPPTQEQSGMIIGGVLGGLLGSQVGRGHGSTAATIIGTMAGAAIGGMVGRSMDDTDRLKTSHALESVRTGVPSTWRNPDTGHEYTVVPTRTYESAEGPCREYTMDAVIGGKRESVHGTACRQADGSWRVTG
jgi:surface antigen